MVRKTIQQTQADAEPEEITLPVANTDEPGEQAGAGIEQFPALAGDDETEVAHRSADGSDGMHYHKTFVVLGQFGPEHPIHQDNKVRVQEEAIQRGLHPKGEATLVKTHEVPEVRDQVSSELTYSVEVVPADVDPDAALTVSAGRVYTEVEQQRGTDAVAVSQSEGDNGDDAGQKG